MNVRLLSLAIATLLLASCGKSNALPIRPEAFTTDTVTLADSVSTSHGSKAVCTINITYPTTADTLQLTEAVNTWIASQLDLTMESLSTTAPDMARMAASRTLSSAITEQIELENIQGFAHTTRFDFMWTIKPMFVTEYLVTYGAEVYSYTGGAHGSTRFATAMFLRVDGQKLNNHALFRDGKFADVTALVREALMHQYFEVDNETDLAGCLLIEPANLELPQNPAYFMPDGVHFTYGQYEIAPYSAGMPTCVLSYDSVRPYLNTLGRDLIP